MINPYGGHQKPCFWALYHSI